MPAQVSLRKLGRTGFELTPIGFGCWALGGGGWRFGMGSQDDRDSIAALERALDLGINWIDTARVYGLGHSEEVVARALAGSSHDPYVFTKCSRVWNADGEIRGDLTPDSLRRELEESLRRLGRDVLDLYQIHQPDPDEDIEIGWETLAEFRREGVVRHIGVSNFDIDQLGRCQSIAPVDTIQPRYSLIDRRIEEEILPFAAEHGIGVISYSPMGTGLLTGGMTRERIAGLPADDWRHDHEDFRDPRLARHLAIMERLRAMGAEDGRQPGELAVTWVLRRPEVTGAIVGFRNPEQVDAGIGAMDFRLSDEELDRLDRFLEAW